jgi:hypothetical protein
VREGEDAKCYIWEYPGSNTPQNIA